MIRTLKAWNSSDPREWAAAEQHYQRYLQRISKRLPLALRSLVQRVTLHDDRIASVQVLTILPSGRDAIMTIQTFRDGWVGTAALIIVHMIGVQGPIRKIDSNLDIMFFDVEILKPHLVRMTFALDKARTWKVDFKDARVHTYNYLKGR